MQDDQVAQLIGDESGDTTTVALRGEIDVESVPKVQACFEEALKTQPSELVVDLTNLRFIDSSGLKEIILADRAMRRNGGSLVIFDPPPFAVRVLEISGLTGLLTIRRSGSPCQEKAEFP